MTGAKCVARFFSSPSTLAGGDYAGGCSTLLPGQLRASQLTVTCHGQDLTVMSPAVSELYACLYSLSMTVNCSGNPAGPGTM